MDHLRKSKPGSAFPSPFTGTESPGLLLSDFEQPAPPPAAPLKESSAVKFQFICLKSIKIVGFEVFGPFLY